MGSVARLMAGTAWRQADWPAGLSPPSRRCALAPLSLDQLSLAVGGWWVGGGWGGLVLVVGAAGRLHRRPSCHAGARELRRELKRGAALPGSAQPARQRPASQAQHPGQPAAQRPAARAQRPAARHARSPGELQRRVVAAQRLA
jgi:hypothetical protein